MMRPEKMLIPFNTVVLSLFFTIDTVPDKNNHQVAEPRKTPSTNARDPRKLVPSVTMPSPVNAAMKKRMVMGFAIVRKKEERKSFNSPLVSPTACWLAEDLLIMVLIPK